MFGSEILDIVIGLIFVYLLLSLICSSVRESIEAWLKQRAVYLERGIRELLHDRTGEGLTKTLYNHPLIFSLFQGEYEPDKTKTNKFLPVPSNLPSYIPSRSFAIALLDIVAHGPVATNPAAAQPTSAQPTLGEIRDTVAKIENPYVGRALMVAIDSAQGRFDQAVANIETWYDSTMDRVSGWYKRQTQVILFCVGLILTILLNVNTIRIIRCAK